MHGARVSRHGSPDVVKKFQRSATSICVVDGCEKPDKGPHGYCDKHYTRIRRNGSPEVVKVGRAAGPANKNWTGSEATYSGAHQRVRKQLGSARQYLCVDCLGPARDWSYIGGAPDERTSEHPNSYGFAYSVLPEFYAPRCCTCHRRYDREIRPTLNHDEENPK